MFFDRFNKSNDDCDIDERLDDECIGEVSEYGNFCCNNPNPCQHCCGPTAPNI